MPLGSLKRRMWQQLSTLLYAGSLLATPATPPSPVPAPSWVPTVTIRRHIEEVRLTFSVDDDKRVLKNLPDGTFTIYDNEQEVSPTAFSADSDLPLRVGLLVDRSDSVRKGFPAEQRAAQQFLCSVLRPDVDSIFLLDFTHQLNFRRTTVGDPDMFAAVNALAPGGQTALYDALHAAAYYDLMTAAEPQPVRRVILLLSDGDDNDSRHSLDDAIAAAQMNDVSIYAITVHAARGYYQGDGVLAALADATGGRAFVLPNLKHLGAVFSEIQDELRSEYLVSFHPAERNHCGYHSLSVRLQDPSLHVRARHGYFACHF
jgi:Ca-activated chloride channel family protein